MYIHVPGILDVVTEEPLLECDGGAAVYGKFGQERAPAQDSGLGGVYVMEHRRRGHKIGR